METSGIPVGTQCPALGLGQQGGATESGTGLNEGGYPEMSPLEGKDLKFLGNGIERQIYRYYSAGYPDYDLVFFRLPSASPVPAFRLENTH